MEEFDDYLNKNSITHKFTALYLPKQNKTAKRVNYTIIGLVWAIFAQQRLSKLL